MSATRHAIRLLAVLLLLTATPAVAGKAKPRPTDTDQTRVYVHNIAGGHLFYGSYDAFDPVEDALTSHRPNVLLLQEVCHNQLVAFLDRHPLYSAHWATTRPDHPRCPGTEHDLYDVVISRWHMGNRVTVPIHPPTDYGSTGNMPCADVYVPNRSWPIHACSVHMSVTKHPIEHAAFVSGIVSHLDPLIRTGQAVMAGGDANRLPGSPELAPIAARMLEVDAPENEWTTGGSGGRVGSKIDHLWFKHHRRVSHAADVVASQGSDHRPILATIVSRR